MNQAQWPAGQQNVDVVQWWQVNVDCTYKIWLSVAFSEEVSNTMCLLIGWCLGWPLTLSDDVSKTMCVVCDIASATDKENKKYILNYY